MATITLRGTKGSPLTNAEVDANFSNINTEVGTKLNTSSYTAADVLAKLITVDGAGSGLDADRLDGLNSATDNTVSTIVARDSSGNFSAGIITATTFSGSHSGAAALTSGTITGITDLAVLDGGTGSSTAAGARTNLGLAIGTDVQAYDAELAALASVTSAANTIPYYTGVGTAASTALSSFGRTLIDDADAATARSTLGVIIGTNVQGFDSDLSSIASLSTTGIIARTGTGSAATRTITGTGSIVVTNGNGVSGDPTIDFTLPTAPQFNSIGIGVAPSATAGTAAINNSLGVGTAPSGTAGQIRASDSIISFQTSDIKYKENIRDIPNALEAVMSIGGKLFDWKDEYISKNGGDDGYYIRKNDFGVIAQDVENVFPLAVRKKADGSLAVDYEKLCALAFAAIVNLNNQIQELKGIK